MGGMFPDNQTIEIFGEQVQWPGVDANGKFTNGSFTDPMVKPSFIPAETINLILNNLEELIKKCNKSPDSTAILQLADLIASQAQADKIIQRDAQGRAKVVAPIEDDDIARKTEIDTHANSTIAVHGATDAATANSLFIRDVNGRAKVASPVFDDDSLLIAPTQWVRTNFNTRTVGDLIPFLHRPSVAEMIRMRVIPLEGQALPISQYQDLFNIEWSPAIQESGNWWYRCTSNGTRDSDGGYFRILDHRGVASRAAGVNSIYKMANDTPYDGGSIGEFIKDAIRNISGYTTDVASFGSYGTTGVFFSVNAGQNGGSGIFYPIVRLGFDVSRVYGADHIADEVRGASISSYLCIKF
ncbi:MAG: hypothetical protein LBB68_09890 [Treponema sp.]|jgi:hypothetical protein|nr:hypothetical protein [Treponema sp.]